jgi:hypothetical protein
MRETAVTFEHADHDGSYGYHDVYYIAPSSDCRRQFLI